MGRKRVFKIVLYAWGLEKEMKIGEFEYINPREHIYLVHRPDPLPVIFSGFGDIAHPQPINYKKVIFRWRGQKDNKGRWIYEFKEIEV